MKISHGNGTTEHGTGVSIELDGDEVATAIDAYLVAHGIHVSGPRTIRVNGNLCNSGMVYVDPSGFVISDGEKYEGSGPDKCLFKACDRPAMHQMRFCRECTKREIEETQALAMERLFGVRNPGGAK